MTLVLQQSEEPKKDTQGNVKTREAYLLSFVLKQFLFFGSILTYMDVEEVLRDDVVK